MIFSQIIVLTYVAFLHNHVFDNADTYIKFMNFNLNRLHLICVKYHAPQLIHTQASLNSNEIKCVIRPKY